MRYIILLLCCFGLNGCLATNGPLSPEIQNQFVGRSISSVEARLGSADNVSSLSSGTQYTWNRSDTRWTTIASSQKIAGTRMVNGRNVASIVNGPPIRTLQTVSCQLVVMTNKKNLVLSMSQISSGMNCENLISRLNNYTANQIYFINKNDLT